MHGLIVYVKERLPFPWDLSQENSAGSYVFDWLYFTQFLTSFSTIDNLLCLCASFLILFHLTKMRFSRSTHLLMFLSLETLTVSSTLFLVDKKKNKYIYVQFNIKAKKMHFIMHIKVAK